MCIEEQTLDQLLFLVNSEGGFKTDRFLLVGALDALASLMIHKSFGIELIQKRGLQLLLAVPRSIYFSDHVGTVFSTLVCNT
jgi:hypothetical protein